MMCEYCGKEFEGRKKKYCSNECCYNADKDRKRIQYVGKREKVCRQCGVALPKNKTRFCSNDCRTRFNHIKSGAISHSEILERVCIICGKEFKTWKSRQFCCSTECSNYKSNHREYDAEKEHERYLKKHPEALTMEERNAQRRAAKEERLALMAPEIEKRKQERVEREAEQARKRAEKEAQKKANIAYWLEYEAQHTCFECGKQFIAHYPTAKYCSDACRRKPYRVRDRYKGITIDKNITLRRLAQRDRNQCQICGLFVDWNDYVKSDKTVICGDMYPSIDHITPISLGGLHSWNNVQLAHRCCNTRKSNKYIG